MPNYVYGRNPVFAALKNNKVLACYVSPSFKHKDIEDILNRNEIKVEVKSQEFLNKISNNGSHQGIVIECVPFKFKTLDYLINKCKQINNPVLVMLDGIKDPHNFGAIIRVVDAFGANGIIIKKRNQVSINMTVAKVSTGAIDYVDICEVSNLNNAIDTLKKNGFWIVSADGDGKDEFNKIKYDMPTVLVIGSEGEGISRLVLDNSDFVVKIPMHGSVNSLNASNATSVILSYITYSKKI